MKAIISTKVLTAIVALSQLASALPRHHHQPSAGTNDECTVEYVTVLITMSATKLVTSVAPSSSFSAAPIETSSAAPTATTSVVNTPPAYSFKTPKGATSVLVPSSSSAAAEATSTKEVPSSSSIAPSATYVASNENGPNTYTPNGKKAGLSGYVGIATNAQDGFNALSDYIGWYSDYSPTTPTVGDVVGVPMLWGDGSTCTSDTDNKQRLTEFKTAVSTSVPSLMFGFYEPDCDCPMSSDISDPTVGAAHWNSLIAPLAAKGTKLGSPSMCKQTDEDWLTPFMQTGLHADWDVTSIHINRDSLEGAMDDVGYYAAKYGKPVWVSEFACVSPEPTWQPCTDQGQIDGFINDVVKFFEGNSSVVAYGPSNGEGLGDVWPLFNQQTGALSASGQAYLNALKGL